MKNVVVIGARGFVGQAVVKSLRKSTALTLITAGRRSTDSILCDLNRPETFPVLNDSLCVINCADNFQASPLPLMEYCLKQGLTLVECTADPHTIERALDLFHGRSYPGRVLLGAGLFPGVSNILLNDLLQRFPQGCDVQLSIFVSPFSQAGESTCRLMAEHFGYRTPVVKDGKWQTLPTLALGPVTPSPLGSYRGLRLYFPEVVMHREPSLRTLESFVVPMPRFLVRCLAWARPILSLPALKGLNTLSLLVLRRGLLKKSPSRIFIHGRASDEAGASREFLAQTHDGFRSIAVGVQVIVEELLKKESCGLLLPHDAIPAWEQVKARYATLAPGDDVRFI